MSPQQIFMLRMFEKGWGFRLFNDRPGSWNTYWSLIRRGYLGTGAFRDSPSGPVAIERLTKKGRAVLAKLKEKNT